MALYQYNLYLWLASFYEDRERLRRYPRTKNLLHAIKYINKALRLLKDEGDQGQKDWIHDQRLRLDAKHTECIMGLLRSDRLKPIHKKLIEQKLLQIETQRNTHDPFSLCTVNHLRYTLENFEKICGTADFVNRSKNIEENNVNALRYTREALPRKNELFSLNIARSEIDLRLDLAFVYQIDPEKHLWEIVQLSDHCLAIARQYIFPESKSALFDFDNFKLQALLGLTTLAFDKKLNTIIDEHIAKNDSLSTILHDEYFSLGKKYHYVFNSIEILLWKSQFAQHYEQSIYLDNAQKILEQIDSLSLGQLHTDDVSVVYKNLCDFVIDKNRSYLEVDMDESLVQLRSAKRSIDIALHHAELLKNDYLIDKSEKEKAEAFYLIGLKSFVKHPEESYKNFRDGYFFYKNLAKKHRKNPANLQYCEDQMLGIEIFLAKSTPRKYNSVIKKIERRKAKSYSQTQYASLEKMHSDFIEITKLKAQFENSEPQEDIKRCDIRPSEYHQKIH